MQMMQQRKTKTVCRILSFLSFKKFFPLQLKSTDPTPVK